MIPAAERGSKGAFGPAQSEAAVGAPLIALQISPELVRST
jgi:hypothetical protein